MRWRLLFPALLLFSVPAHAFTFSISGNAGLAGATVVEVGLDSTQTNATTADGSGNYSFSSLNPGRYDVYVSAAGYLFSPTPNSQTIVASNLTGVDFTANVYTTPTPGAWIEKGAVIASASGNGVQPGNNAFHEAGCLIVASPCFKSWYMDGTDLYYAESLDAVHWSPYSGNPIISGMMWVTVFKNAGTYYLYCSPAVGPTAVSVYTASDGVTFTLQSASAISVGGVGTWDHSAIYQLFVVEIVAGTWRGIYTGTVGTNFAIGYATSSDGITWTKYVNNPVWTNGSAPYIQKIGSTYYAWLNYDDFHNGVGGPQPLALPTDVWRIQSTDLIHWTNPIPSLPRTRSTEGVGLTTAQTSMGSLLEVTGKTYFFYMGSTDGTVGTNANMQFNLAVYPQTMASLVTGNEGVRSGNGTLAFVQSVNASGGAPLHTSLAAPAFTNTENNTLTAYLGFATNTVTPSISDTQLNTWTLVAPKINYNPAGGTIAVYTATNCKAGANTVTGHWSGTGSTFTFIYVREDSGGSVAGLVGTNTGASGVHPSMANLTVPASKASILAFTGIAANNAETAGPNFTIDFTSPTSGASTEHWLNAPAGSQAVSFGSNATANWGMLGFTLLPAVTPSGGQVGAFLVGP